MKLNIWTEKRIENKQDSFSGEINSMTPSYFKYGSKHWVLVCLYVSHICGNFNVNTKRNKYRRMRYGCRISKSERAHDLCHFVSIYFRFLHKNRLCFCRSNKNNECICNTIESNVLWPTIDSICNKFPISLCVYTCRGFPFSKAKQKRFKICTFSKLKCCFKHNCFGRFSAQKCPVDPRLAMRKFDSVSSILADTLYLSFILVSQICMYWFWNVPTFRGLWLVVNPNFGIRICSCVVFFHPYSLIQNPKNKYLRCSMFVLVSWTFYCSRLNNKFTIISKQKLVRNWRILTHRISDGTSILRSGILLFYGLRNMLLCFVLLCSVKCLQ